MGAVAGRAAGQQVQSATGCSARHAGGVRASDFKWGAPGPGMWFLAREHVPLPVSRLYFEILSAMTTGWDRSAEVYGLPDGPVRWGLVNGWMYFGGRPIDPAIVANREPAAAETLRIERWNVDARRWHDELKPRIVAANPPCRRRIPARWTMPH